jgi:cell division protein FtsB
MRHGSETAVTPAAAATRRAELRRRVITGAVVFVGCVLLADSLIGERGLTGTIRAREDYNRMSNEVAHLKAENAGLREQARRLHEDPTMVESVAREELGLIRSGEILVVVKDVK